LKPGGLLLASVMMLWGSARRSLFGTLALAPEVNQRVTSTGDLTPDTIPQRQNNFMHMFRSHEVRQWLANFSIKLQAISASGVLANGYGEELARIRQNPEQWAELLRMELEASADPGCLDLGTHLIFVGRKEDPVSG
jgi:hypothetical protein